MSLLYAAAIAVACGCGLYLVLSRHLMRITFGIMLISTAVNLVIFLAGRIESSQPPVMAEGETVLQAGAANPLPQALVLTAIVIGFSLAAFMAALVLRAYRDTGATSTAELDQAEQLGSPFGKREDDA